MLTILTDPPRVTLLQDETVVNGTKLAITCPYTPGNPADTMFTWRRERDGTTWHNQTLILEPVNYLLDDSQFTCIVNNTKVPTVGPVQEGRHNGTFKLTVWCKYELKVQIHGFNDRRIILNHYS